MFKPIPGNNEYLISLAQEFRSMNGDVVTPPDAGNGKVEITIYGEKVHLCKVWLSLVAHYELYLPDASLKNLNRVYFVPNDIKFFGGNSSQLPVFRTPLMVNKDGKKFRVVPNHSRYAVSFDGELISVETGCLVRVNPVNPSTKSARSQYPTVYIYDPDKAGYRYVFHHRLVAMAWVKNPLDHYVRKPIVNHIDGNKSNFVASNLEWCSFRENSLHVYSEGLRNDGICCRVRNFETGEVLKFPSKSQAAEYMGVQKTLLGVVSTRRKKASLLAGKFEFRTDDDDTPWFYENRKNVVKPGRYMLVAKHKDGTIEEYFDLRDFKKKYGIWNTPNANDILKLAKMRYPEIAFELTDFYGSEPIQAYDVKQGKILEAKSISEVARLTGLSDFRVRRLLSDKETKTMRDFAIRYKKDTEWDTNFEKLDVPRSRPLLAENIATGEKILFPSLRAASRGLGLSDRYWIKNCVEHARECKGWMIKVLENGDKGTDSGNAVQ